MQRSMNKYAEIVRICWHNYGYTDSTNDTFPRDQEAYATATPGDTWSA